MKEYYYAQNKERFGPFDLETLKTHSLDENTLIWHKGLQNWKNITEFPELAPAWQKNREKEETPPLPDQKTSPRQTSAPGMSGNHFERPPKTWLVESILATFICCIPFGIAGIVNASQVESKFNRGDVEGAQHSSKEAGKWTKVAFFCGLGFAVLYLIWFLIMGASAFFSNGFNP